MRGEDHKRRHGLSGLPSYRRSRYDYRTHPTSTPARTHNRSANSPVCS